MLKIALLQLLPTGSADGNLKKGVEACRKAKALGADIALFPEMWSSGYRIPENMEALKRMAVSADGAFVSAFGELAAKLNMAIAITFLEKTGGMPRNSVSLFDRHGKRLYTYAKVHTCDFADEKDVESGKEFKVCNFEGIQLGIMICYDREYPESARILMVKGAEVILVPNDCGSMQSRIRALSTRAY